MVDNISPELRQFPSRPWAGVVVVVMRGAEFLLTLRAKPPGYGVWGLPGGALHLGETSFDSAIREVREETGILCQPLRCFTAVDVIERAAEGPVEYHFLLAAVLAEWLSGDVQAADDAQAARWFTLENLSSVRHFPYTDELVRQAITL